MRPTTTLNGPPPAQVLAPPAAGATRAQPTARPWLTPAIGLTALALLAGASRLALLSEHSAYIDEATYILTGRFLIERQAIYADVLNWAFGSYLWPLMAGAADMVGGLTAVRLVAAGLGVITVLATAVAAYQLSPREAGAPAAWSVGLLAGLIMAVLPTPIALGHFGTYDAPAIAAFSSGIALLATGRRSGRAGYFLAAAGALFVAFLAKYIVAVYFPFICLYLLFAAGERRALLRNLLWFVGPLSAACALYFLALRDQLLALLAYASNLNNAETKELASATPLREYVTQRPDILILLALALLSWSRLSRPLRLITFGGAGIMLVFQLLTRADYDWWKHAIYSILFLAPAAALTGARLIDRLLVGPDGAGVTDTTPLARRRAGWLVLGAAVLWPLISLGLARVGGPWLTAPEFERWHQPLSLVVLGLVILGLLLAPLVELLLEERQRQVDWRRLGLGGLIGVVAPLGLAVALTDARGLVTFYPDLTPALATIQQHTAGARTVLTDDTSLRYYLYGRVANDQIVGPFSITYREARDERSLDVYRRAITARHFDVIVLDGGIGPLAGRLRRDLSADIDRHYERVATTVTAQPARIDIFRPRAEAADAVRPPAPGASVSTADDGFAGWGSQPESDRLQPGLRVALDTGRTWQGRSALRFDPSPNVSFVGVGQPATAGPVTRVRAWVYLEAAPTLPGEVWFGIAGFDHAWQWHDDGFTQIVSPGRWTEVVWELPQATAFNIIGFKFVPQDVTAVYIGRVDIER